MASQSNQSYSFDGYVVECRGSGHEAAPRALFRKSEQWCVCHCAPHIVFQLSSGISPNAAR
jgi:hypothetical protein